MIIDSRAWARIVEPLHALSSDEFYVKLRSMYGIRDMKAQSKYINCSWEVEFVSDYTRTMFMLQYGHLL